MNKNKKSLVIVGAGGQCKVILDSLNSNNYNEVFIEDKFISTEAIYGFPVISKAEDLANANIEFVVAIGDNFSRSKLVSDLQLRFDNIKFATIVHPKAYVAASATLGEGTVVCAGSVVGANSRIEEHVIINTNSSVDHDCHLKPFCSIGPNSTLGGNTYIGNLSVVAISATISHGVTIADNVIVGASSLVLRDIASDCTVWRGIPARKIRKREIDEKYL